MNGKVDNPSGQTKEGENPNVIHFPFDPARTPRAQIEEALAQVSVQSCRRHPDQLRPADLTATIRAALRHGYPNQDQPHTSEFSATFPRCSRCLHSEGDRDIEVKQCPISVLRVGKFDCCSRDDKGRPVPRLYGSAYLEADRAPREQFDEWVTGHAKLRCPFSNELLNRREVSVKYPFDQWVIEPRFVPCFTCSLESLGLSPDEASASFDNFITDPPVLKEILDTCRTFARNPKGMLLLLGNCGTGKTHLAIAILRDRLRRGSSHLAFIKHRRFLAEHWRSLRPVPFDLEPPESPLLACQKANILVYDELAVSPDNRTYEDVLLDLFEYRIGHFKPTVITANFSREELETVLGTRLYDRLRRAAFAVLELGLESKRDMLNSKYLNKNPPLKTA